MIRISYNDIKSENAEGTIHVEGHASAEVCAAFSALWYAFVSGVERLHELHPEELGIYEPVEREPTGRESQS